MASIFSKIIAGDIPCYKIAENDLFLAFLDVFPLRRGHVLVVPKLEVDRFFDIEDAVLAQMMQFAKPIAAAIESVVPCNRVGLSVIGLEVPHAHLHLVPISSAQDLNFTQPKLELQEQELRQIQQDIVQALGC
jgi:histidine triad (HIT) family protein